MAKGILIIAEQRGGTLRKISFELVSEGRRLADQSGQPLAAVVLGHQIAEEAKKAGRLWGGYHLCGRCP